jgi:hypothetical protein
VLTAELRSRQPAVAKQSPESSLRTRGVHSKLSSLRSHVV